MRNKQQFEEHVYELYRKKQKKRLAAMKKFTIAGTALVAAACIVFVFVRFNREIITPSKETTDSNGETLTESATEEIPTDAIDDEATIPENSVIEDGFDGEVNGIPEKDTEVSLVTYVTKYPEKTKQELSKSEGIELFKMFFESELEHDANFTEENDVFYELLVDEKGYEYTLVYNNGFVNYNNKEWIKIDETSAENIEEVLTALFE